MSKETVELKLTYDEALVLFEFFARSGDTERLDIADDRNPGSADHGRCDSNQRVSTAAIRRRKRCGRSPTLRIAL